MFFIQILTLSLPVIFCAGNDTTYIQTAKSQKCRSKLFIKCNEYCSYTHIDRLYTCGGLIIDVRNLNFLNFW